MRARDWVAAAVLGASAAGCGPAEAPSGSPAEAVTSKGAEEASARAQAPDEEAERRIDPSADAARLADLPAPYNEANLGNGKRQFYKCRSCHLIDPKGRHSVGPDLYGVFGRQAGTAPGFAYSEALTAAGFAWSPPALDQWLASPTTFLPGNAMRFVGVPGEADRRDLIAWLMLETTREEGE